MGTPGSRAPAGCTVLRAGPRRPIGSGVPIPESRGGASMQDAVQARAVAGARMGAMDAWSHGIPAALVPFVQKTYGLLTFSLVLAAAACWATIQWMPVREVTL